MHIYLLGSLLAIILISIYNRMVLNPLDLKSGIVAGIFSWFMVGIIGFSILYTWLENTNISTKNNIDINKDYLSFLDVIYVKLDKLYRGVKK